MNTLLLLLSFVTLTRSSHIEPIVNSTGEYYITNETFNFQNESIDCNSTLNRNCYIICSSQYSCKNTRISCLSSLCDVKCDKLYSCLELKFNIYNNSNSNISSIINFQCNGNYSCLSSSIYGNNANISILCAGKQSCSNMNATSTNNVSINCFGISSCQQSYITSNEHLFANCNATNTRGNSFYDGACYASQFYCNSSTINKCIIICESVDSCITSKIFIPSSFKNGFMDLKCNDNQEMESCLALSFECMNNGIIRSNDFVYNAQINKYQCSEVSPCCPWNPINQTNITCIHNTTTCSINCNNYILSNPYYPQKRCSGLIIDGSMTNSLNINCSKPQMCSKTTIYCPNNTDISNTSNCSIYCGSQYSCKYSAIYGNMANDVQIYCGHQACYNAKMESISGDIFNISCIDCSFSQIHDYSTKNVQINCMYDASTSCEDIKVEAIKTNNLTIVLADNSYIYFNAPRPINVSCPSGGVCNVECNGIYSCYKAFISMDLANSNINLQCKYKHSCDSLVIQSSAVGINNVSILCNDYMSCSNNIFNINKAKHFNLKAYGNNNTIYSPIINVQHIDSLNIECVYGQCTNILIKPDNNFNTVNIICDQMNYLTENSKNSRCYQMQINAYSTNINMICNGLYSCNGGQLNAESSNLLNLSFSSNNFSSFDTSYKAIKIDAQKSNEIHLYCNNYGCLYEDFILKDGLNNINVTWNGNCQCESVEQCITSWDIYCDNDQDYSQFNGNICKGSTKCCTTEETQQIINSFHQYWYNGGKCGTTKAPDNKKHISQTLAIEIGAAAFGVLLLAIIGLFYFFYKRSKKKQDKYQKINS